VFSVLISQRVRYPTSCTYLIKDKIVKSLAFLSLSTDITENNLSPLQGCVATNCIKNSKQNFTNVHKVQVVMYHGD
jgi:hypothetical protein